MNNRTTIVLGAIAAALLAYIAFVDEGSLSTGELEGRAGHVVERFVRSRVTRLELTHGDVHIVLVRDQDEEEDMDTFDVGTWALSEPVTGAADVDSVDALLSAVEWLDARRELDGITAEDRTRFGFDEPRASLTFEVAHESHTLTVGGEDPRGEGVYVQVDDPSQAFVVGSDLLEALTHDVEHYRSKELFPDFRTADVRDARLSHAGEVAHLERTEGRWRMREPFDGLARASAIDEMLRSLGELRAERFLAESPDDGAVSGLALGLDAPSAEIVLSFAPWPERSSHSGEERPDLTLRIGLPCPEHPSERVARVSEGPVVCVSAAALERLEQPVTAYRELRLVSTPDDDIERVEVAAGSSSFSLERDEGDWNLVSGGETSAADPAAIEEWLGEIRVLSAALFEPATEAGIAARGLGEGDATATLTLHRTDDGGTETVHLGVSDADGVWVRRGDEAQLAQYPSSASALLNAPAIRFRGRTIIDRERDDLASFTVVRASDPGDDEVLHKEGSSWTLEAPITGRADGALVADAVDALAPLTALRFVASAPARAHGLDAPRFIVRASFDASSSEDDEEEAEDDDGHHHEPEDSEEDGDDEEDAEDESRAPLDITLRIGAPTEGGAFAQQGDDPAVFVVPASLVDALADPFVSRDTLSVAASELQSLSFTRGGATHTLARTDGGWQLDAAEAPSEATLAMLDALAGLRAVGTMPYDAAPLRAPILTLAVERRDGTRGVLSIGAADADLGHPARLEGSPAGYRLSPASIERLLSYPPG